MASGGTQYFVPSFLPDGSRIAYSSARKAANQRDLFWKAAGGTGAEELVLADSDDKAVEDWSPDGKFLFYSLASHDFFALPVTGDRKPFPVLKAEFRQDHGRVSPDGNWIAYVARESGRDEVFVQHFPPSGGKWQISSTGATEPSWRRDGKELYFVSGSKFKAVEVKPPARTSKRASPRNSLKCRSTPPPAAAATWQRPTAGASCSLRSQNASAPSSWSRTGSPRLGTDVGGLINSDLQISR